MAISTYKTFLMHGTGTSTVTYEKLVDITSFPDLGGDPEMIDVTTLSDRIKKYIMGIQDTQAVKFDSNYDKTEFEALKDLEGATEKYAVWFGGTESNGVVTPTGSDGKFAFDGQLSVHVTGGGVNEAVKSSITIAPSTEFVFS